MPIILKGLLMTLSLLVGAVLSYACHTYNVSITYKAADRHAAITELPISAINAAERNQ